MKYIFGGLKVFWEITSGIISALGMFLIIIFLIAVAWHVIGEV